MRVNVVGLGHRLRHDDALGLFMLDRLQKRGVPDGVRLIKAGSDQTVLNGIIANPSHDSITLIVDAICLGAKPGTIHFLPNMTLPDENAADEFHLLAMRPFYFQTMEARPGRLMVIGLEPADLSRGVGLTPIVRKRLPALEVAVRSCIVQIIRSDTPSLGSQAFESVVSRRTALRSGHLVKQ